ncbi:hypothetical protein SAMD00019534_050820 [Acytostelium subglobosum LB1]|uniref:hypothetical protein n=1 Tax=Acytostelium subglobosum LB1 TaxID=1410327 RepID=UPI0006451685|nr:hypothetical protein SAMD00019534_050820 [Acytostelium subglobosum LB1]GAM21907.1 hypothetical protein SAMD00019534_050820 [Acytostelium subglobosum LB1]|eukprot:XP_012755007.1 hypothetical protein SAMD00019534_050820 [Acytostelium subglobosum LB1]
MQRVLADRKTSSLKGNNALFSNIVACIAVGDVMRSLLGPRSRDKLLVNEYGEIIITNDGVTVMKSMNLEHPAAKMMVELSKCMDDQNGDGTTSVVVLASLLLRKSLRLLQPGGGGSSLMDTFVMQSIPIHPLRIIQAYIASSNIAIKTIKDMSIKFDFDTGRDMLLQTARTTLNSKLVSHLSPSLPILAVDSVMMARKAIGDKVHISTQSIDIIGIDGASQEESFLSTSLVMSLTFFNQLFDQPSNKPHKLALLGMSVLKPSNGNDIQVTMKDGYNLGNIVQEEESIAKSIVVALKRAGATIVCVEDDHGQPLSNLSLSYFSKAKISVLKSLPRTELKSLSEETGSYIFNNVEMLKEKSTPERLATLSSVSQRRIGNRMLLFMDVAARPPMPTIILRGTTQTELEESKRALHDAVCVLRNLTRNSEVVPGGGACEAEAAAQITKNATMMDSPISALPMIAFAEALMEIPETLCINAGLDHLTLSNMLRASHTTSSSTKYNGINLNNNGSVEDMVKNGVLETTVNKLSQIT